MATVEEIEDIKKTFQTIVNGIFDEIDKFNITVNGVTAYHRHGQKIPARRLDDLSNHQISMEEFSLITRKAMEKL